jgi:hypothetical protein
MLQIAIAKQINLKDASFTTLFQSEDVAISDMSLATLEKHCLIEIDRYYHDALCNEQYGLEMFRRATVLHDPYAWEALQRCFSGIARSWLRRHPRWEMAGAIDSEENYVAQAFTRLWYASTKNENLHFQSLSAALGYLRASLNGTIMDTLRSYSRPKEMAWPETDSTEVVMDEIDETEELWTIICSMLSNEREIRVAYLHFRCGLKAREILQFCPEEFKDAQEIYSIRRNMFKRLMRNADQIRWRLGAGD